MDICAPEPALAPAPTHQAAGMGVGAVNILRPPLQPELPATGGLRHLGPIAGIAARGDLIATAGYDNRLILWDARSRQALGIGHHDHLANHCAFSADGRWLVSASSDYTARVWALPSMKLHAVLGGHDDDVDMAVFSPDDGLIGTCALDRIVRVFDRQGRCLHAMSGHTGNVLSLAWSSDGRHLVSSSVDGTIRTWDVAQGTCVATHDLEVRTDSLEMTEDGTIYAGDDRGRIAVIRNGVVHYTQAHCAGIKKLVLAAQGDHILCLSYDRSMSIWQLDVALTDGRPALRERARTVLPACIWARAAAVLADGRIVAGTFGSTYAIYDPHTDRWDLDGVSPGEAVDAVLARDGQVYSVGDAGRVCRDGIAMSEMGSLCNFLVTAGGRLFCGGQLGTLMDADTGVALLEHHSPLNCAVSFERRGQPHLAVGTYTGEILVLSLGADCGWRQIAQIAAYGNAVKGLCVSDDGLLFSVCANTDIAWHRLDDWSLQQCVQRAHERIANACCALGQGRYASIGRDRQLRLWRLQGGQVHQASQPSPHSNSVKCMATDSQRRWLLTGSYGGTLALFDLHRQRWDPMRRPTHAGLSCITWDESHHRFVVGSYDGRIYTYTP